MKNSLGKSCIATAVLAFSFLSNGALSQSSNVPGSLITFCKSPVSAGLSTNGSKVRIEALVFTCENGQSGTLNELLGKGWRLHSFLPNLADNTSIPTVYTLAILVN